MHYNNIFELLIAVFFSMSPQLILLGPKSQYLLIPFRLDEGEPLPDFHLRALAIRSEILIIRDQTGQINNLTGKVIM